MTTALRLVCGVDGGQTSTRCVLATLDGRVIGWGTGGPLVHLSAQDGPRRLTQALAEALERAWQAANVPPQPLEAICLGLTGVESGEPEADQATELVAGLVQAGHIDARGDAETALEGAHAGQPGVIIISGTGTIALGRDASGRMARAGGWGWLLGDEGSAFAIGRAGLLAALHAADGLGPATALEEMFTRHFAVAKLRDIKRVVYAPGFGAAGFAALASVVSRAAAEGDQVARGIVRAAGRALAQEVAAVLRQLDFRGPQAEGCPWPVPVAAVGGAFEHVSGLRSAFAAALRRVATPTKLVEPQMSPALGAVMMALRACGADWRAALPNLRGTKIG